MVRPSGKNTHEKSLKIRTLIINLLEETLPPYTEKAEREKITEFQKCINPTYLTLYKQI
jgi:hypothetical protein